MLFHRYTHKLTNQINGRRPKHLWVLKKNQNKTTTKNNQQKPNQPTKRTQNQDHTQKKSHMCPETNTPKIQFKQNVENEEKEWIKVHLN